jgi:hypothetical protein
MHTGSVFAILLAFSLLGMAARWGGPQEELQRNEDACAAHVRPGFVSYPVTRWGELRGCVVVPETADPQRALMVRFVPMEGADGR